MTLDVPRASVADVCRLYGIRELALFGSAVRDDFAPESDVDVLVDFQPEAHPTLFTLARLQEELERVFSGRQVDLVMKSSVSPYLANRIMRERVVVYGS